MLVSAWIARIADRSWTDSYCRRHHLSTTEHKSPLLHIGGKETFTVGLIRSVNIIIDVGLWYNERNNKWSWLFDFVDLILGLFALWTQARDQDVCGKYRCHREIHKNCGRTSCRASTRNHHQSEVKHRGTHRAESPGPSSRSASQAQSSSDRYFRKEWTDESEEYQFQQEFRGFWHGFSARITCEEDFSLQQD